MEKGAAKKSLKKGFVEGVASAILISLGSADPANTGRGHNRQRIMMSVRTFKEMYKPVTEGRDRAEKPQITMEEVLMTY
jgi:hypothetical protein